MLAPTSKLNEIDFFAHVERPGVQLARDFYALANENFEAIGRKETGCITVDELSDYAGNRKLKDFLNHNSCFLTGLSFSATNLNDLLRDLVETNYQCCISSSDLNTFSSLSSIINRRIFYDGNFQSLREGAGLHAAGLSFVSGIVIGWTLLAVAFTKMNLLLPPAESIAFGIIATVGIPICLAMLGYVFGTRQADHYFDKRVQKIDQILEYLEQN